MLEHAHHGRTDLTMALTAKDMPYERGFGPFAPEVHRVPTSYPFRDPAGTTGEEAARRALEQVAAQVAPEDVAAVLVEPVQGEGRFVVPAPGFLPALAAWCREHGALLVADEVQTGFCRTGDWFACRGRGRRPRPDHDGRGHGRWVTARGGDRARRRHGRGAPRWAGLVVLTARTYGNVLRFLPPLVMPEHLLDEGLGLVEAVFAAL